MRYRRGKRPTEAEIADLFLSSAINSVLLVKKLSPNVSEAAIDMLSVLGLSNFPPGEGGPLNYLLRLGRSRVLLKLEQLVYTPALVSEAEALIESAKLLVDTEKHLFLGKVEGKEYRSGSDFQTRRSELIALSAAQLKAVGPARGVVNQEVFLYPLPAIAAFGALMGLVIVILSLFIYFVFFLF